MSTWDYVIEKLHEHDTKPFALRVNQHQWNELKGDRRAKAEHFHGSPGDPPLFMGVSVRIETARAAGRGFKPQVFATPDELHEAIYG